MARILIIADTFPPNRGGSEAMLEGVAEGLAAAGHDVAVYTPTATSDADWGGLAGVTVRRSRIWFTLQQLGGHSNPLVNRGARFLVIVWLFLRLVWRQNDVVIAGHPLPAGTVANALQRWHRCLAVMLLTYGEEITMYGRGSRMRELLRRALIGAQSVVTIAECNRAELEEIAPGIAQKIEVIPPAVESPASPPDLNTIRLSGFPVLFTLSRLVERKGIDTTIKAVALLREEFPSIRYYVAGRGPDATRLQALAKDLGLNEEVVFLGPVDAPDFLYPQAHIFCMPNRTLESGEREGFGMVFLEAGLHGVPSIGGRSGGAVEAVLHGETGLLVDPDSPEAVAQAVRDLMGNDALSRQMGAAAKAFAMSFSRQRMADRYVWCVQRLLDKAKTHK